MRLLIGIVLISLICTLAVGCRVEESESIDSASAAYTSVISFLDFAYMHQEPPSLLQADVHVVHFDSDLTPYVRERMIGHAIWKVEFDSISVDLPGTYNREWESRRPRKCTVYLDSTTAELLCVVMTREWATEDSVNKVDTTLFSKCIRNWTINEVNLRRNPLFVGFFDALNSAVGSNPYRAVEVIGIFTDVKETHGPKGPQWWILGKGIDRTEMFGGPGISPYPWGWTAVDAVNGRVIVMGTSPEC